MSAHSVSVGRLPQRNTAEGRPGVSRFGRRAGACLTTGRRRSAPSAPSGTPHRSRCPREVHGRAVPSRATPLGGAPCTQASGRWQSRSSRPATRNHRTMSKTPFFRGDWARLYSKSPSRRPVVGRRFHLPKSHRTRSHSCRWGFPSFARLRAGSLLRGLRGGGRLCLSARRGWGRLCLCALRGGGLCPGRLRGCRARRPRVFLFGRWCGRSGWECWFLHGGRLLKSRVGLVSAANQTLCEHLLVPDLRDVFALTLASGHFVVIRVHVAFAHVKTGVMQGLLRD